MDKENAPSGMASSGVKTSAAAAAAASTVAGDVTTAGDLDVGGVATPPWWLLLLLSVCCRTRPTTPTTMPSVLRCQSQVIRPCTWLGTRFLIRTRKERRKNRNTVGFSFRKTRWWTGFDRRILSGRWSRRETGESRPSCWPLSRVDFRATVSAVDRPRPSQRWCKWSSPPRKSAQNESSDPEHSSG